MGKNAILAGVKKAFFAAMMAGYAGDGRDTEKVTRRIEGYETIIEFSDGDFNVVDRYYVPPDSICSAGTTTIFFYGKPVWWMSYSGSYSERVIPFLKSALRETYLAGDFVGGRGPRMYHDEEFRYDNFVTSGDFRRFKGYEQIRAIGGDPIGFHEYLGMSLLCPD